MESGKSEDVRIATVNGVKYIRTDANSKAADNLSSLPAGLEIVNVQGEDSATISGIPQKNGNS